MTVSAPPRMPRAFLLDFDGVIVDSAELKTMAFAEIYGNETSDTVARIVAYQRHHGGVSRHRKFVHFEREMLGRPAGEAEIDALCARFGHMVQAKVIAAPMMAGAQSFLDAAPKVSDLFLISGTPATELRQIVGERGWAGCFVAMHGAPETKHEAFQAILAAHSYEPHEVVAVGDAITECEAARSLGIPFVGITPPNHDAGFPPDIRQVDDLRGVAQLYGIAA